MKQKRSFIRSLLNIAFALGFVQTFTIGQQTNITLLVTDETTSELLPGANVTINGDWFMTDANGKIETTVDFPLVVSVSYIGFDEYTKTWEKPENKTTYVVELIPSKTILDAVTVTGSRFERNLTETTISLDIIRPDLLRSNNTAKSSDILNKVPGVQILDGQANIRGGSGYSYGAGSRVMLLMNDIPALQVDAGFPNWNDIPVEILSQIEVVKGAASSMYGSAALNGIVNFRTAYAVSEPETRAMISYNQFLTPKDPFKKWWGSDTRYQANASLSHKQKWKKVEWVASAFFNKLEGFLENTDETRGRIFSGLRYKFHDRLHLELSVNANVSKGSAFFLWKDSGSGAMQALPTTVTNRNSFRLYVDPVLTYIDKKNNKHKLLWRLNTIDNENDTNQSNQSVNNYVEYQFQNHYKPWDLVTTTGLVGLFNTTNSQILGDTTFSGSNLAAYIQVEKKIVNKLFVTGGMRYENVLQKSPENFMGTIIPSGKTSDGRIISRFGLNYELAKYTFLRTSWGQGYRFPTLTERFVTTTFGAFSIFSNPLLKPETGWSFEAGIKQGIPGMFKGFLDVSFFTSEYQDMIEFTFVPPPTLGFQPQNVGNIRITGFEVSLIGQLDIGKVQIQTMAGYTYIDPIYKDFDTREDIRNSVSTDQNVLKYRARHQLKADMEAKYKKAKLGVSFQRASHVVNIDRAFEKVPPIDVDIFGIGSYRSVFNRGYYLLDARVSYTLPGNLEVTLLANNILNDEYSLRPALVEAPRNVAIRLEKVW